MRVRIPRCQRWTSLRGAATTSLETTRKNGRVMSHCTRRCDSSPCIRGSICSITARRGSWSMTSSLRRTPIPRRSKLHFQAPSTWESTRMATSKSMWAAGRSHSTNLWLGRTKPELLHRSAGRSGSATAKRYHLTLASTIEAASSSLIPAWFMRRT